MTYKIITDYLTPNKYSRPGTKIKQIKGLVIHWFANPKSSAKANRNFFENRKHGKTGFGSAHELIDLDGTVYLALPEMEMGYHVGSKTYTKEALSKLSSYPNNCTYGIECSHLDWDGTMTDDTYNSLVERCVTLCKKFSLNPLEDLWLHQEVVGWKDCHRWFVNNPKAWTEFKQLVNAKLNPPKVVEQPKPVEKVVTEIEEDEEQMKLIDYHWAMIRKVFVGAREKGFLENDKWERKATEKSLTKSEAIFLMLVLFGRKVLGLKID